jgi:hypothetical protein
MPPVLEPEPEPDPQQLHHELITLRVHTAYKAVDTYRHDLRVGEILVLTAVRKNGWSEGFKIDDPKHDRLLFPTGFARPVQLSPRRDRSEAAGAQAAEDVRRLSPVPSSDDDDFDSAEEDESGLEFHDASPSKLHLLHTSAVEEISLRHMEEKVEISAAFNRDLEDVVESATEAAARAAAAHSAKVVGLEEAHQAAVADLQRDQKMLVEMHEEASLNYDKMLAEVSQEHKEQSSSEMAVWQAKTDELDKVVAHEKALQQELQAELQASQAECAKLQASVAQSERVLEQTQNELRETKGTLLQEREQASLLALAAQTEKRRLESTVENLEKELEALSAKRSMVHAVFAKLGDGDEDDLLEADELDELVEVCKSCRLSLIYIIYGSCVDIYSEIECRVMHRAERDH